MTFISRARPQPTRTLNYLLESWANLSPSNHGMFTGEIFLVFSRCYSIGDEGELQDGWESWDTINNDSESL